MNTSNCMRCDAIWLQISPTHLREGVETGSFLVTWHRRVGLLIVLTDERGLSTEASGLHEYHSSKRLQASMNIIPPRGFRPP